MTAERKAPVNASHSETIRRCPALIQETQWLWRRVMPYGTIIFIALILAVACGLLGWLSALLADTQPKRDGKAFKKPPISNWK